jgi:hypothetical protein
MIITRIKLLIILFLFYLTYSAIAQEQISSNVLVKGTVTFVFERDSIHKKYWLKKSILTIKEKEYFLSSSVSSVALYLEILCDGKDTLPGYWKRKPVDIFDVKQYQDTAKYVENRHMGGDGYLINENLVAFVFHIKAYIVKIHSPPCNRFPVGRNNSCPIEYEKGFYPIAVIVDVLKAKSLTRREIKRLKFKKIKDVNIEVGYCD